MPALNIYCDESTHLPNDGQPYMVLGAIICPAARSREVAVRLREIRAKHQIPGTLELKWTKVSPSKLGFYRDIIDYFFDDDDLSFRAVVASKRGLDHARFGQTHDDWYYTMMFNLIRNAIPAHDEAFVYFDKKDTNGQDKIDRLSQSLINAEYDFSRSNIRRMQIVESYQVGLLQLADLLIGAINYANRGDTASEAKMYLIERIRERSGINLIQSTLPSETKMNIYRWRAHK
ncbi:DUF3800 domain-containing protein [Corynebacterium sp. ES2794-CONJ1]|uniref:DUF3800 domain-containing protein n=1 Tax=unclassified Corynebacterium TaxID=2624378 RepID=UPI002166EA68|nr:MULTISPECIES: DUF3800 domain-containing protein [unclassified Corynebacterium]MCS4489612.1 DUF3800 domain-containing protein [Corynebacterium sp. ES2775-CONJ]MCS4531522.1 DUF3800 domain-containing protein [Corynebacterium sp. ES2730-CONJ]MCU9518910.1 DUF3800 domain-containing protein [Corynebacterium sp. ES2794-CONJ1]